MRLQKLIYWLVPAGLLVMLFTGLQGIFSPAAQVDTAYACNPCDCPHDARINCQGVQFYAVYTRDTDGDKVCNIDVYRLNEGTETGLFAFSVNANQLASLPEQVAQNTLIAHAYDIALFKLTTGELQVSAGPDPEGKVYTVVFQGCPAEGVRENSFIGGPPVLVDAPTIDLPPADAPAPVGEAPADGVAVDPTSDVAPADDGDNPISAPVNAPVSVPTSTPEPVEPPELPPGIGITPG